MGKIGLKLCGRAVVQFKPDFFFRHARTTASASQDIALSSIYLQLISKSLANRGNLVDPALNFGGVTINLKFSDRINENVVDIA